MALKFGKYILLNKIATGGMAEVFRAKHIGVGGFEKIVAIKRILPHFSHNEEFITMFNEEAKVSAQLSHQNIVQIYEFGMIDGSYYIAMEYVDGINLNDLLINYVSKNTTIPLSITLAIIRDSCKGLDYAHRKKGFDNKPLNLVHRDISPKNIMVSFDGAVKVMDFGIAKAASRDYETRTGVIKGKISYLSPEQVQGARLDKRSDVFSLGIVFYEMLTGTKCFKGESDFSILFKIKNAELDSILEINPTLDEDIQRIVLKSLAQTKEARYQSCEEMAIDIEHYLSTMKRDPMETNISLLLHQLETELRDEMAELEEYFPEKGEEYSGEVFHLEEDGRIPDEIGSRIAEESGGSDISSKPSPVTRIVDPHGTQSVGAQPSVQVVKRKSSRLWAPVLVFLLLAIVGGGYVLYRGDYLNLSRRPESQQVILPGRTPDASGTVVDTSSRKANVRYAISVISVPEGSTVSVNGVTQKGTTPTTLEGEGEDGTELVIAISRDCYTTEMRNVSLVKGSVPRELKVELKRMVLDVVVNSSPEGAELTLDGKVVGKTPYRIQEADSCLPHDIELRKDDYDTVSKSKITFAEPNMSFTMTKQQIPGQLKLTSTYPVTIMSGSSSLGQVGGSGTTLKLKEGTHNLIAVSKEYCIRHQFSVTIEPRKTKELPLVFGQLGNVRINSIPYSEVSVNGFNLGTTPLQKVPLPEGFYDVEWNFVTLGKKKTERLKVNRGIHQEWRGSMAAN